MTIHYVSGDLFANRFNAQAFAHGCNCQGKMGAGIAVEFKQRYPTMYQEYQKRCLAHPRQFNLGDAFLWKEEGRPWVFNLGTQIDYWRSRATYEAIQAALEKTREECDREEIHTLAMPKIAAGHGGLSWKRVRAIIERVFASWPGTLYVYEEFFPESSAPSA